MSNLIGGLCTTFRGLDTFGYYKISGTITELGVAGIYPVVLYLRSSFYPLMATFSDANGNYQFTYIKYIANGYFAVAFDHGSNPLNAAIADLITPELMP